MGVLKFASHYMLSPDGEFVKWPVVAVDQGGEVKDVYAHPGGFREEPGVRFFSGLMLPAFIDCQENIEVFQEDSSRWLNRQFSRGTLYLISSSVPDIIKEKKNLLPMVFERGNLPAALSEPLIEEEPGMPVFDRMLRTSSAFNQKPLEESLTQATSFVADKAGLHKAGRIAQGYVPGLILIQNLDLINLKLQPNSTVKWLNVPDLLH